MIDPQVAFDKIASFETVQEVRKFLQYEGITGLPAMAAQCPISNYMTGLTGRPFVTYRTIHTSAETPGWTRDTHWVVQTPPVLFEFIESFDAGLFPELVSQEVPVAS